jgi:hypothetical protein
MPAKTKQESDSDLIQKGLPCANEDCNSSDAVALYSDGHTHCFSCNQTIQPGKSKPVSGLARQPKGAKAEEVAQAIGSGEARALPSRKISQATCRHWDYLARTTPKGHHQHLAIYRDKHGAPLAIKVRDLGKDGKEKSVLLDRPEERTCCSANGYGARAARWLWSRKARLIALSSLPAIREQVARGLSIGWGGRSSQGRIQFRTGMAELLRKGSVRL